MAWNSTAGITDIYQIFQLVNTETNQLLAMLFLGVLWVVSIIAMGNYAKEKTILAASMITLMVGVVFWSLALVSGQVLMILVAITLISFFLA